MNISITNATLEELEAFCKKIVDAKETPKKTPKKQTAKKQPEKKQPEKKEPEKEAETDLHLDGPPKEEMTKQQLLDYVTGLVNKTPYGGLVPKVVSQMGYGSVNDVPASKGLEFKTLIQKAIKEGEKTDG